MAVKTTDEFVIPLSVKDEVTSKLKEIEKAVKSFMSALDQGGVNKMSTSLGQAGSTAAKVSKGMKDSGDAAKAASSSISIYGLTLGKVSAAIFTANAYLDFFNRTVRTFSATIGAAVAPAIALESGLAKINTVLPEGTKSLESFKNEILAFQSNFGSKQEDVIRGYYDMLQSGAVDAADSTNLMTVAQKMAVAGFSTSDKMIQGLISVLANYNMEAKDAARIADLMAIANMNGRVSIEGLADNIGQVAGLANMMNISLEETMSAMSTISMATSNSAEAMTSFRAIITGMSTQTGEFSAVMQRLGYNSIQAMIAQKGFIGTIQALIAESGNSAEALSSIFGRVEAKVGLAALTAEKTAKIYGKNMDDMKASVNDAGSVIEKQFGMVMDTTSKKLEILSGSLTTLLANITFGSVDSMKDSLDGLIEKVQKLNDNFKSLLDTYALLNNGNNIIIDSFKSLGEILVIAGLSFVALKVSAVGSFSAVLIAAAPVVGTVLAMTAAVEGATWVFRNWDTISYELGLRFKQMRYHFNEFIQDGMKGIYAYLDGLNRLGLVSDKFLHDYKLSILKGADAQKELNKEIENSKATYNEMAKDMKGSFLYDYFTSASKSVEIYGNKLNEVENNARLVADALKDVAANNKKVFLPETKTRSLNGGIDPSNFGQFEPQIDDETKKYKTLYNDMNTTYKDFLDTRRRLNAEFQKQENISKKDEYEKSIAEAEKKYRNAVQSFQQFMADEASASAQDRRAKQIEEVGKNLPIAAQSMGLEDEVDKWDKITDAKHEALAIQNDIVASFEKELDVQKKILDMAMEGKQGQRFGGYEVPNVEKAAQQVKISQQLYDKSALIRDNAIDEAGAREDIQYAMENENNLLQKKIKLEKMYAGIKEKGGLAAFDMGQIETVGKNFGAPMANALGNFTGFMAGPLGMVSAAGMILDGLTSIVNMVAELPGKAVGLIKAVNDMPVKILKSLDELPKEIIRSIAELPKMLVKMINRFADLGQIINDAISEGVDKLFNDPEMFNNLGQNFAKMLVSGLRAALSGINLFKVFFSQLGDNAAMMGSEISKGFVLEFKRLANDFAKFLDMKPFFDIDEGVKKINAASEKLNNNAMQMFSVTDLGPSKQNIDMADRINKATENSNKKTESTWSKAIANMLKTMFFWENLTYELGMWTWNNIMLPIIGLLKEAWLWVWEKVLSPIVTAIKGVWLWVWEKVISPIIDGITAVFQWAWDKIFSPIIDGLTAVFQWAWDKIFMPIIDAFKAAWDGIVTQLETQWNNIVKTFEVLKALWTWVWDKAEAVFNWVSEKLGAAWEVIKNIWQKYVIDPTKAIFDGIGAVFQWIANLFKPIFDVVKDIWDGMGAVLSLIDWGSIGDKVGAGLEKGLDTVKGWFTKLYNAFAKFFNNLKIPELSWSMGKFGSGKLWSEIDLIPGEIAYMADGGLVSKGTDTVPAMLTPGEFVVNRQSAMANMDLLRAINSGSSSVSAGGAPIFNITINASTLLTPDSIKRDILPAVERELKRKSLDGSFVIAASGIRK